GPADHGGSLIPVRLAGGLFLSLLGPGYRREGDRSGTIYGHHLVQPGESGELFLSAARLDPCLGGLSGDRSRAPSPDDFGFRPEDHPTIRAPWRGLCLFLVGLGR